MVVVQQSASSEARDRVLVAAYDLFVQRGFADVSMQQIADEASITKATLYHHFRDKQDLYLATMRMAFTKNHVVFMDQISQEPDVRELIGQIFNFLVNKSRTDMHRLMSDFHQHISEEAQQTFWVEFPKPWRALEPVVQRCMESGSLVATDPRFVSQFIYSAVAGYAHILRTTQDFDPTGEEFLNTFVDTVLHGICPNRA